MTNPPFWRRAIADHYRRVASIRKTMVVFGCSSRTVQDCVKEAGYEMQSEGRKRILTRWQELQALIMFLSGKKKSTLARHFRVSRTTIVRTLVERGVKPVIKQDTSAWPDDEALIEENKQAAVASWSEPVAAGGSSLASAEPYHPPKRDRFTEQQKAEIVEAWMRLGVLAHVEKELGYTSKRVKTVLRKAGLYAPYNRRYVSNRRGLETDGSRKHKKLLDAMKDASSS